MSENSKMSQIWHQVAQIPSEGTPWLSGFSAPDYDQSFLAETTWVMLQMLNPRRPTFGFVYTAGAVTSSSQCILSLLSSEHCSVTADCTRLISSFKRAFRSCGENVFVVWIWGFSFIYTADPAVSYSIMLRWGKSIHLSGSFEYCSSGCWTLTWFSFLSCSISLSLRLISRSLSALFCSARLSSRHFWE